MILRTFIPLIALIVLKIIQNLEDISKHVRRDFVSSYQRKVCARGEVYGRNIEDAFLYLQKRFPQLEGEASDLWEEPVGPCEQASYSVYRETNEELELLYPNWVYRETVPQFDGW